MDKKTYRNDNFDPKAAAEARKQEMDALMTKLEAGVKDVFKSEHFKTYLQFCARLPRYSLNNQLLIMMAKPDATMCMSFNNWKEMGRSVKKGERGIRIMAPAPYKMMQEQDKKDSFGAPVLDKDGEPVKEMVEVEIHAFKPVSTFDISQTEGEPVPTLGVDELVGSVDGYKDLFDAIVQVAGIPVEFEKIDSGAKGYYNMQENRIAIKEGMSEVQNVKTALHELSHSKLHSREKYDESAEKKSSNQKETEAESVAYICCAHYGLDTSEYSFPYLAGWAGDQDTTCLRASLETIKGTACDIIRKVDEILKARVADKFIDEHAEELPFDNPFGEVDERPAGFIVVEPPIDAADIAELDKKNEIELTSGDGQTKPIGKEDPAKKKSVMDKLARGKEKAAKTPKKEKGDPEKNKGKLQEAI